MPSMVSSDGRRMITGYIPNNTLSYIGLALYALLAIVYTTRLVRQGSKYMLPVTIASACMAAGFAVRIPMHDQYDSIGIYIGQYMLLLLSPCAFLAQSYMVLPRLATYLQAEDYLFFRSRIVVRLFVWSDVVTFFLQASGGGLTANDSMATIGKWITIVGLALQLVSFVIFTILAITFGLRVRSPEKWHFSRGQGLKDWRAVYFALLWTTIGILVRCVFRLAEFAQGYDGTLRTVEIYFYVLDALPLWLAIVVWTFVWPPAIISPQFSPFVGNHEMRSRDAYTLQDKESGYDKC